MTHQPRMSLLVKKEVRELGPVWLACIGALVIGSIEGSRSQWMSLAMIAYVFVAVALGGLSMGHEYSHHTLTALLSQPVTRKRLFLVKLSVLAAMLVTLAGTAIGALVLGDARFLGPPYLWVTPALVLPLLGGLFLAPWMTMLGRRALSGIFFTFAIPAVMWAVTERVGVSQFGLAPSSQPVIEHLKLLVLWYGTTGVCVIGAVMGWRTFMRLEAIDGGAAELHLPRWLSRRGRAQVRVALLPARRSHPVWLLIDKELHLQQMTFVFTGLYLLGSFATWWSHYNDNDVARSLFVGLTVLYGAGFALLVGALASAEERQLGTLEWQVLLPVATRTQWAVKVGTTLVLAALFAFALPAVMVHLAPWSIYTPWFQWWILAGCISVLTLVGLYVSSLCSNGLRAAIITAAAIPMTFYVFGAGVLRPVGNWSVRVMPRVFARVVSRGLIHGDWRKTEAAEAAVGLSVLVALVAGLLIVLIWFGLRNHRSSERGAGQVWWQVACIAGYLMMGVLLLSAIAAFWQAASR